MATHDYVIDNSTGANVRADINNVLQAILTNNSSASAPGTTAAYMWWADTTNGILKIRNSNNTAWVELLQLDGTLTLEDGTKTAPALAHRSNLNTGIFFSAANKFNVSTGGVERLELGTTTIFNDEGADVDFRIEGDDEQNLFYVDAGNDRIGIGTSSPATELHVVDTAGDCIIRVTSKDGNGAFLDLGDVSDPDAGRINYDTGNNLVLNTVSTERLRIDSSGNVGIGTTSPSNNLHVATSSNGKGINVISSGNTYSDLNFSADRSGAGNHIARIQGQWNGGNVAQIIFNTGGDTNAKDDGEIGLATSNGGSSPTYRLYIKQDGKIGIGTTNPDTLLHIQRTSTTGYITSNTTNDTSFLIQNDGAAGHATMQFQVLSGGTANTGIATISAFPENASNKATALSFGTRNQFGSTKERMRVTSDGDVRIGTPDGVQNGVLEVRSAATSGATVTFANSNASYTGSVMLLHAERETVNSSYDFIGCRIESPAPGVQAFRFEVADDGDVRNVNGFIGTISDISLKENIVDANSQWNDFKNLKFRSFNFKESTGFSTHKQIGLVAQEVETVCPNLVRIGKEDENTKERHKYVGTSILYMKGMKALQEAIAKIEVLETKVAALEAA